MRSEFIISNLKKRIANLRFQTEYFVFVYGSMAYGDDNDCSDIDLMMIVNGDPREYFPDIMQILHDVSTEYECSLDCEIPYVRKLVISSQEARSAVSGGSFYTVDGAFHLPPVEKSDLFLSSPHMVGRLIVNAIGGTNRFIAGSWNFYEEMNNSARDILVKLMFELYHDEDMTPADLVRRLISDGKYEGEHYLGFKRKGDQEMLLIAIFERHLERMANERRISKSGDAFQWGSASSGPV